MKIIKMKMHACMKILNVWHSLETGKLLPTEMQNNGWQSGRPHPPPPPHQTKYLEAAKKRLAQSLDSVRSFCRILLDSFS